MGPEKSNRLMAWAWEQQGRTIRGRSSYSHVGGRPECEEVSVTRPEGAPRPDSAMRPKAGTPKPEGGRGAPQSPVIDDLVQLFYKVTAQLTHRIRASTH